MATPFLHTNTIVAPAPPPTPRSPTGAHPMSSAPKRRGRVCRVFTSTSDRSGAHVENGGGGRGVTSVAFAWNANFETGVFSSGYKRGFLRGRIGEPVRTRLEVGIFRASTL